MDSRSSDRTSFTLPHTGPRILPNIPLFAQLLRHGYRKRPAIRDVNLGLEKTYEDLLSDVLLLRASVSGLLSPQTLAELATGQEIFIGVLAAGGFEYAVAMLTVLALGAAAVPMTTALPVNEAVYYVRASGQVAIITSSSAAELGKSICDTINKTDHARLEHIEVLPSLSGLPITAQDIFISSNCALDANAAGVVIFTSGTTGPPKAVVMRRSYVSEDARSVADHFELTANDTILHVLPVHHATGIGINFFPFLGAGACVEFKSGSFDPAWTWERWRKGRLTFFSGVPTIYMRMMRYYEQNLAQLPEEDRNSYEQGARQFRGMLCGTSALPRPVQQFWTKIRGGNIIQTRYGATEFGAPLRVPLDPGDTPDGSVGRLIPGVDLKLSEGEEGEVLVKSSFMFAKYLNDNAATAAAHDENGYYKTGDIARREGHYYFIVGRASQDIIKSGGYKISALDIEREALALPYIGEVVIVGVDDQEFGQRVGAVVTLREGQDQYCLQENSTAGLIKPLTIAEFRRDLRGTLANYKIPTLLRVLKGEIPKTSTGKVQKRFLGPRMFPSPGWELEPEVQAWRGRDDAKL